MNENCSNCGAAINGTSFCAACGTPVLGAAKAKDPQPTGSESGNHLAMWAHLAPLITLLVSGGSFFWLAWLAPLLIRNSATNDQYAHDQATKSLNFQLQWLILGLAIGVLGVFTCGFGFVLFAPAGIFVLVAMIMATVASAKGSDFKYPMQFINFVK